VIRPHALRQANAFFSPDQIALQFGYFDVDASQAGLQMPGSRVYTCLSHDIVAHETTHAILDGMHRRFTEPSNPDVLGLHEAFADIVALLQHFTIPEILAGEIARTRGNLETESIPQPGGAVRAASADAVRFRRWAFDERGVWRRRSPIRRRCGGSWRRARGAVLVAAC
jgi:hypothetical protein